MLLSHQRLRQHPSAETHQFNNLSLHDLPVRTSSAQFLTPVPAETDIAKLSHSPSSTLDSSPAISNLDYAESSDYYMPRGYSHNQPTTRAYPPNSRPASTQPPASAFAPPPTASSGIQQTSWNPSNNNAAHLTSQPLGRLQELQFHKRHHSSDSTATSAGPQSPFTPVSTPGQPYIVDVESQPFLPQHFDGFEQQGLPSVTSYPKSLSNSNAPFSDSAFFSPQFQNFSPQYADNHSLWEHAMKQAMTQQPPFRHQQDIPRSAYRMNLSQASAGDSNGGESDAKAFANGHARTALLERSAIPNLDRTISDAYQDELYNPEERMEQAVASRRTPPSAHADKKQTSPTNSVFSERLLEASQGHISARSASPTAAHGRENSPFRPHLGFAAENYPHSASPVSRLGSAAQMREQQKMEAEAIAIARHNSPRAVIDDKTVSPKDVSLDYEPEDEAASAPLIPELQSPARSSARSQQPRSSKLKQELTRPDQDDYEALSQLNQLRRESSSNFSNGSNVLQQSGAPRIPQQYPFVAQQHRPSGSARNVPGSQESNPQFPAPLPSMESTMESMKSEPQSASPKSSRPSTSESEVQRPTRTNADTGTYTCTYHGCTLRFETPQKLQKHKREGHRQGTPQSTPTVDRDTQAGPHKCERINPTTGKPCNSIFSRPYDLTRHEDTIHNARKQKARCQLCTEEKTFSRNDALTRHMRVVHPEVDFPGKVSKRRGG